ncbi:sulfite exporter TauE/SafE family protein [Shewanella avicenniae]|uniref:Probable membrane transporter protein n=2 Tax=Shewanella avicenniae TaxID=2814294 RepID=A0ABX7QQY0_9GAMM|nr:sulfite exporter TauE/SafE family protein [Shewanella avicenniae]
MTDMVWVYLVLMVGACLQSVIGFGLGLLCAPVLFLIYPQLVPAPMILNALFLTLLLSVRNIRAIDVKQTSVSVIGGTLGVGIAGLVMLYIEPYHYKFLLGSTIILGVIASFVGHKPVINLFTNLMASTLSGFMGTTTSAGGAPMGLLYQSAEHHKIKANLSVFFLYINIFGLIVLWYAGSAGYSDVVLFIQCIPAILLGWLMSEFMQNYINNDIVRKLTLLASLISGIASFFS